MEYRTLYRKWRPQFFEDIIGQEHITKTLMNAITLNRVAHAYIFSGPRGVGKTTTARILAKSLNCKNGPTVHPCNQCESCIRITDGYSLDVIEIDGASNRGIDDIRELRTKVKFAPSEGKYRVYIIDEVHMLTAEAFNALLKTLEEPPSHIIFIFATTAPHKIPETITSRCQWFNFRRIPLQDILDKLKIISESEKLEVEEKALKIIARYSTGSMRDAESMLDQLIAYCGKKIDFPSVKDLLGVIDEEILEEFLEVIINQETSRGIEIVNRLQESGRDSAQFVKGLMEYIHNLILMKYCTQEIMKSRGIFMENWERLKAQSDLMELNDLFSLIDYLAEMEKKLRYFTHPWILLEMLVVKFTMERNNNLKVALEKSKEEHNRDLWPLKDTGIDSSGIDEKRIKKEEEKKVDKAVKKQIEEKKREKKEGNLPQDQGKGAEDIKIKEILPRILEKIKKTKISLYSFLMVSNSINVENDKLIICFSQENCFHKESLEKKNNRMLLRELLYEETGRFFNIECLINNQSQGEVEKVEKKEEEKTITVKDRDPSEKDHPEVTNENSIIKESLNLFEGKIIKE